MNEYYIGLMSGTSLDAVDAVLMDFSALSEQRCVHHVSLPYSPQTREQILALQDIGTDELNRSNLLANQLSLFYIQAVKALLAQTGLETNLCYWLSRADHSSCSSFVLYHSACQPCPDCGADGD